MKHSVDTDSNLRAIRQMFVVARVAPRWAPNNSERNNEPLQILQQTIPVIARLQRED